MCRFVLCGEIRRADIRDLILYQKEAHIPVGLTDLNLLYDSFLASLKGSAWKEEPQRFEIDFLTEIVKLKREIETREYKTSKG